MKKRIDKLLRGILWFLGLLALALLFYGIIRMII